jgi:hypothetical protein
MTVLERFEENSKELIDLFCSKNDLEFKYWINDIPCGLCQVVDKANDEDYFIEFDDIWLDMAKRVPPRTINRWVYDHIIANLHLDKPVFVTYYSYLVNNKIIEGVKSKNSQ